MHQSTLCQRCNRPFVPAHRWDLYCSIWCRRRKDKPMPLPRRTVSRQPITIGTGRGLSTGTVGAIGELMVASDLMQRGYHVFRALSPNAPCDIVAFRAAESPIKIEVKTGSRRPDGTLAYPNPQHPFDVLAVALVGGEVVYQPPID